MTINENTIKTIYLRHDSSSQSLSNIAISQIIIRILFLNDSLTKESIKTKIKQEFDVEISNDRINKGIEVLIKDNYIQKEEGKEEYYLSENQKEKLERKSLEKDEIHDEIIKEYFKEVNLENDLIKDWFINSSITLFRAFSKIWIKELFQEYNKYEDRNRLKIITIISDYTVSNYSFDSDTIESLTNYYLSFLSSTDPRTNTLIWEYGTSAFSAMLINSGSGIDNLTIENFKNNLCILDTNILFSIKLGSDTYSESLKTLEKVFLDLNIKAEYLHITEREYKNTFSEKTTQLLNTVKRFPLGLLEKSSNALVKKGMSLGCVEFEDFENFSSNLMEIPKTFSRKVYINKLDNKEIQQQVSKAFKNETLKSELSQLYNKIRHKVKHKNSLNHDSGIISVAEHLRNKKIKCFILSHDSSICEFSKSKPIYNDKKPIAISLDSLINIFAIGNGDIDIDPTDFSNLFANIVKNKFLPNYTSFRIEDLERMVEIDERIAQLPDDSIVRIAKSVQKKSLVGRPKDEITLYINRAFQKEKLKLKTDLENVNSELIREKSERELAEKREAKLFELLKETNRKKIKRKYIWQVIFQHLWRIILLSALFTFAFIFFDKEKILDFDKSKTEIFKGILIGYIPSLITTLLLLLYNLRKSYKERIKNIEKDINDLIKN